MHKIFEKKTHVYFDMGNTLLDFHQGHTDDEKDKLGLVAMSSYLSSLGLSIKPDIIKSKFLTPLYNKFHLRERDLIEIDVYPLLRDIVDLEDEHYDNLCRAFYSAYMKEVVVHDYALDLLKDLKDHGKYIGIISNCFLPAFIYEEVFKSCGLDDYIDDYTFSYTYKIRKPQADLFHHAFKADKSEMLMVGDGFKPDVLGSSDLGVESIWYNHKGKPGAGAKHLLIEVASLETLL